MTKEEFLKYRKELLLYSATIASLVTGVLFQTGKMYVASDKVSFAIATILILGSYLLLQTIGARLNKKGVHGVQVIAWAAFILYTQTLADSEDPALWLSILSSVTSLCAIFYLVYGVLQFALSLTQKIRDMDKSQRKTMESVETVVAVVTSIAAIIISIIAL